MPDEKLGEGAWGIVYKGEFHGCDVAVTHVQYTWTESGRQLLLTTRLTGCRVVKFKKEVSFTAGSRTA